jgi:tetratricopeptide (TPR) repeat protein
LLYHVQNKIDQAKASYEKALAIDPRAAVASNNLAQLFIDRNENLEVALKLAETAKAGLPDYHEVDDTLGMIYYKKGLGQAAVTSFKAAVAKAPDNPLYMYRLGLAHLLNKDKAAARQALEKALAKGEFPGADDARKVLASLKG